jgi:hypothetical protein
VETALDQDYWQRALNLITNLWETALTNVRSIRDNDVADTTTVILSVSDISWIHYRGKEGCGVPGLDGGDRRC